MCRQSSFLQTTLYVFVFLLKMSVKMKEEGWEIPELIYKIDKMVLWAELSDL